MTTQWTEGGRPASDYGPPANYYDITVAPVINGGVSVKDFGAKGDGVTDDTAAFKTALSSNKILYVPAGVYVISDTLTLTSGQTLQGDGPQLTTLKYTGTGSLISSPTPDTRTFGQRIYSMRLDGPGKTSTAVGIDFASISSGIVEEITATNFGKGFVVRSSINGGAVYNRLTNTTASVCGRGYSIEASGSNATMVLGGRCNVCTTGVHIEDSNQFTWVAGEIEGCTLGVYVHATSAALADNNGFVDTRFEGNTTAWETTANVRSFMMIRPKPFGTYTILDNGTRTEHNSTLSTAGWKIVSQFQVPNGSFQFERIANGGTEVPAFVVRDSVSSSGTPVTVQAQTERALGYPFRAVRGGTVYWDVDASGNVRAPQGGVYDYTERTNDPVAPATNVARLYAKDNGAGKTQLMVRFATGAPVVIATEP